MEEFSEYLSLKCKIKSKQLPFYVNWVKGCYGYLNCSDQNQLAWENVQKYLYHLEKMREPWQVKQAEYALRLYKYFQANKNKDTEGQNTNNINEWEKIFKQTKDLLRLQQKSQSTEKTYMHWIKRFAIFYKNRLPEELSGEEFKNFLSSLAVERRVGAVVPTFQLVLKLVENSDMLANLPAQTLVAGLDGALELHDPPIDIPGYEVHIAWHRRLADDRVAMYLADFVHDFFAKY